MTSIIKADNISTVSGSGNITIPTGVSVVGTDAASIYAPGHIIQIIEDNHSTNYVSVSTTSTWTQVMSTSITPKFATSKIFIAFEWTSYGGNTARLRTHSRIMRGSTNVKSANDIFFRESGGELKSIRTYLSQIDSPATTSSVSYSFDVQNEFAVSGSDIAMGFVKATLMEIAQ